MGSSPTTGIFLTGNLDRFPVFTFTDKGGRNITLRPEETAGVIDEETKRIVDEAYNRAKQILTDHVDKLHAVAKVLLEKEKIEADEFEKIFAEE